MKAIHSKQFILEFNIAGSSSIHFRLTGEDFGNSPGMAEDKTLVVSISPLLEEKLSDTELKS